MHRLLSWINQHDCGVVPCGILNDDNTITIRVALWNPETKETTTEETRITNMAEARDALGY